MAVWCETALSPLELLSSSIASLRLRAALVCEALHATVISDPMTEVNADFIFVAKIVKHADPSRVPDFLAWLASRRASGARVIVDYTDNKLPAPGAVGDMYRRMMPHVDAFTTGSTYLSEYLEKETSKPVFIVDEPCEFDYSRPTATPGFENGLWFGHPSNLKYVFDWLPHLGPKGPGFVLRLVTDLRALSRQKIPANFQIGKIHGVFEPYSRENLIEIASKSDFVLLPSSTKDSDKAGASANRLVSSIALGLPAVATPIRSYSEIGFFSTLMDGKKFEDICEDLNHLRENMELAQATIKLRFDRSTIKTRWISVFESL